MGHRGALSPVGLVWIRRCFACPASRRRCSWLASEFSNDYPTSGHCGIRGALRGTVGRFHWVASFGFEGALPAWLLAVNVTGQLASFQMPTELLSAARFA